jgi:hypothetical protein
MLLVLEKTFQLEEQVSIQGFTDKGGQWSCWDLPDMWIFLYSPLFHWKLTGGACFLSGHTDSLNNRTLGLKGVFEIFGSSLSFNR